MSVMKSGSLSIVHEPENHVFRAVSQGGKQIGHLEYRIMQKSSKTAVEFYHTFTDPEARGKGIASKLVDSGLEWAKGKSFRVIPSCTYVAAFMEKNKQYQSLL